MRNIYIILTYTGTSISKMIKGYTKDEFSHVSISLDIELKQMYSFGRIFTCTPLIAGFVQEYINKGTYKRFYKTKAKIYSMQITDEQYDKLVKIINQMKEEKRKYRFNMLGLVLAAFNIKVKRKKAFYCAEFVKYVLEGIGIDTKLPEIVKPEQFKQLNGLQEIYEGLLSQYKVPKQSITKIIKNAVIQTYGQEKQVV